MGLRSHDTRGNDSRRRLKEFSRARVVTPGQGAAGQEVTGRAGMCSQPMV